MSNFAILEICFVIIALLAFFLRETVLSLSLSFLVFSFILYLASYNSVSILVKPAALSFYVSYVKLEVLLLVVLFLQLVINAYS